MSNISNIFKNNTRTDAPSSYAQDSFVLLLYAVSGIVAIIGNGIVLSIILRNRTRRFSSATYALIANMALSDLIAGFVIFGQFGFCSSAAFKLGKVMEFFCMSTKWVQIASYFVSTYSMAAIAYERLHVMRSPFAEKTRPNWYIAISWIVGCTYVTICTFDLRVSEFFTPTELISCKVVFRTDFLKSQFRTIRASLLMVLQFIVPLTITGVLYTWLVIILRRQQTIGEPSDERTAAKERSKRRMTIMLICTVIVFAVSWFPVHVWHFYKFFQVKLKGNKCNSSFAYSLCYWFAVSSCAWNPFIYCSMGSAFRTELSQMFHCDTEQEESLSMSSRTPRTSRSIRTPGS